MSVESLSGCSNPAASRIFLLFRFAWPGISFRIPLEPDLLLSSRLEFLLRSFGECSLVESADFRRPWVLLVSLPGSWIEVRLLLDKTFLNPRGDASGDGIELAILPPSQGVAKNGKYEGKGLNWGGLGCGV